MIEEDQTTTNTLPGVIFGGIIFAIMIGIGFVLPPLIGLVMTEEGEELPHPVVAPIDRELLD